MVTPAQKRDAVEHLQSTVLVGREEPLSQRRAAAIVGASRRSVRRILVRGAKDEPLQKEIEALAQKHPRYGDRRVHALLQRERLAKDKEAINIKRVHRLWKESQAQVPPRKRKRNRSKHRSKSTPLTAL